PTMSTNPARGNAAAPNPGGLFRAHVHAHPDGVAGVVVHARGVVAAGVLVGDVVGGHATMGTGGRMADGHRLAHGHLAAAFVPVAARGLVDLATGHAAYHRADGRGRVAAGAATHLAAQDRTDDAAHDGGDHAPVLRAAARTVTAVVAAVRTVGIVGVVRTPPALVDVAVVARVAALAGRGLAVGIEDGVDAHHAGDVVAGRGRLPVARVGRKVRVVPAQLRGGGTRGRGEGDGKDGSDDRTHGRLLRRDGARKPR